METIIQKSIEGGYKLSRTGLLFEVSETHVEQLQAKWRGNRNQSVQEDSLFSFGYGEGFRDCSILLDPLFWQALGRACNEPNNKWWRETALSFHEINLTEGWDKAVEYLLSIIK